MAYEACAAWCKPSYKDVHCSNCACKACGFCAAPVPGAVVKTQSAGKTCAAASVDDGKAEDCKLYCTEKHSAAHCARCDCKACPFCAPERRVACAAHNSADSSVASCETFCNAQHATSHCPLCRCKLCSFCNGPTGLALPPPPPDAACATVTKRGAWSGGIIAQVRMKVWEAGSVVRLEYEPGVEVSVAKVQGASLRVVGLSTLTFTLADTDAAVKVGANQLVRRRRRTVAHCCPCVCQHTRDRPYTALC